MRIKISSGYLFAALGLAGTGMLEIVPDKHVFGWVLIALAVTVLLSGFRIDGWHIKFERPRGWKAKMSTWGPWTLIVGGPLLGFLWLYLSQPVPLGIPSEVFAEFERLREANPQLGNAGQRAIQKSGYAYQANHEKAMVLWIEKLSPQFIFFIEDGARPNSEPRWIRRGATAYSDPKYADSDYRKKAFNPPDGKHAPYAGVAKLWELDPPYWKKLIGWLQWHANLRPGGVDFQEFDNGIIVGPILKYADEGHGERPGQLFLAINEGAWRAIFSDIKPPSYDWLRP
jgi:hypothetical protein